jgi:hypothetical protein
MLAAVLTRPPVEAAFTQRRALAFLGVVLVLVSSYFGFDANGHRVLPQAGKSL